MDDDRDRDPTRQPPADPTSLSLSPPHRCGRCGTENPADATFCDGCHALLAAYDAPAGAQPLDTAVSGSTDGRAAAQDAPASEVAVAATAGDEPARAAEDPGATIPPMIEAVPEVVSAAPAAAPPFEDEPAPSWFAPPWRADERSPAVAVEPERAAPSVAAPVVEPSRSVDAAPAATAPAAVPPPAERPAPIPTIALETRRESASPVLTAPREAPLFRPAAGPRKPGRLARTSPAALLLAGGLLALGATGLIVAAEVADAIGGAGIAGLVLGALALYVLALGLIQAVLRR